MKLSQRLLGILLAAGLLLIAFTQILTRFVSLPDFVKGALTGIGIGLEIIAIIKVRSMGYKRSAY